MPAKDGFQLTDGDIALLHFAYQLRLATLDHLAALTGRSYTRTHKRVSKLEERRYFNRITKQPQKALYTIGTEGVSVLIEHGYAPESVAQKRLRAYELKDLGRQHTLFIADIHAKLILLTKGGPVKLTHWQEGPSLWDQAVTPADRGGNIRFPIRPDAYFVLEHTGRPEGKNRLHFFLEADRSTMSHERMAAKTKGYVAYHHQGLYQRRYPAMKYFLVATVTRTRERAVNLRQDLAETIPPRSRPAYLFLPFKDLTLESFLPSS
jgi:hypothetical protein